MTAISFLRLPEFKTDKEIDGLIKVLANNRKPNLYKFRYKYPTNVNNLNCSVATKNITKGFLTTLYNYARELDVLEKNRAEFIQLPKETSKKEKNIFIILEIKNLWKNKDTIWVEYVLIMIYTGMRIGELVELKKKILIC